MLRSHRKHSHSLAKRQEEYNKMSSLGDDHNFDLAALKHCVACNNALLYASAITGVIAALLACCDDLPPGNSDTYLPHVHILHLAGRHAS